MMWPHYLAVLTALPILNVSAQSPLTIDLFIPEFLDFRAVDASVVAVNPPLTTYALNCPAEDCPLAGVDAIQYTIGPTAMTMFVTAQAPLEPQSISYVCQLGSKTSIATCIEDFSFSEGLPDPTTRSYNSAAHIITTGILSDTIVPSDISDYIVPVTITAGADKLHGQTFTLTSTASSAGHTFLSASVTTIPGPPAASSTQTNAATHHAVEVFGLSVAVLVAVLS